MLEQDSWHRIAGTGQYERGSLNKRVETEQRKQDNWDLIVRTGQWKQDSRDRTAYTGQLDRKAMAVQPGQDSRDMAI